MAGINLEIASNENSAIFLHDNQSRNVYYFSLHNYWHCEILNIYFCFKNDNQS